MSAKKWELHPKCLYRVEDRGPRDALLSHLGVPGQGNSIMVKNHRPGINQFMVNVTRVTFIYTWLT